MAVKGSEPLTAQHALFHEAMILLQVDIEDTSADNGR
jgi:hypothetical protein